MKTTRLTGTDLTVSQLSLGTAQFGTGTSGEEAFRQMDIYSQAGGNFLDTAHVYGEWGIRKKGMSEIVIGQWMKEHRCRSQVVLATKGCHPPLANMLRSRVDGASLREDVEGSLSNLQTDYIDLYFLHRDDPRIPAGEILEALEEQTVKGNLRYYGCSNWSLSRVKEAADYARAHGLKGFVCNQMMFTLADVAPQTLTVPQLTILDDEYYQYHKETGMSFMAYMCMAGGYFTKKLCGRKISLSQKERYRGEGNEALLRQLKLFTQEGYEVTDFLYTYVTQAPFPAVPIAGFSSVEQLKEGLQSIERTVPQDMMDTLTGLKRIQTYRA